MYDAYYNKENLNPLLAGKVSLEYAPMVTKWIDQGIAKENRFENFAFNQVENKNPKLDFILKNLK